MMILFFKSVRRPPKADEPDSKMPIEDKMKLILDERVDSAETDEERARAERERAKLGAGSS